MAPIPEMTEEEFQKMVAAGAGASGASGDSEMSEEQFAQLVAGEEVTEAPVSEDTLTATEKPWYSPVTEGVSGIPAKIGQNLAGLIGVLGSPVKTAQALLEPSNALDHLPTPGGPFGVLTKEIMRRPNLVRTGGAAVLGAAGLAGGTAIGHPFLGAAAGGSAGDFLASQANQMLGTTPDTPIRADLTDLVSSFGADAAMGGVLGKVTGRALSPERQAADRAARETTLGAKLITPKGTTGNHTILAEKMAKHREKIIQLNPFRGVNIADPNAFPKIIGQAKVIKEGLNAQKAALLREADQTGATVRLGTADIDQVVAELRGDGINITDNSVRFAKDKLVHELNTSPHVKMQYEAATYQPDSGFTPFQTRSEFQGNTALAGDLPDNYKSLTPTEAQEYIRRNVDDRLNELKKFDTSRNATEIIDKSEKARRAAEEGGLDLIREAMDRKIREVAPGVEDINDGISAMIDLDDQLRMASAGVAGSEVVLPGQGLPAAAQELKPGLIGRTLDALIPTSIRNRMKIGTQTDATQNMQAQMLGPIQEIIRRNTPGGLNRMERFTSGANGLTQLLGGDAATGMMMYNVLPRNSVVLQQDPQQAARVLSNEAYKQALKMTGSEEAAASVAQRTGADAMKAASSGSPEEMKAFIGAASKALPGAFQPGEYPDEVDGTVYDPRSKMQMEDNAKLHLSQGTVDSIAYAKQKQEAWRNGPSKIVIHKDGQISPDLVPPPQEVPVDDAAIFADSNQTNY